MTKYRCLNCPQKPIFLDLDHFKEHWSLTHVVSMEQTETDPWGERPSRTRVFYEVVEDAAPPGAVK